MEGYLGDLLSTHLSKACIRPYCWALLSAQTWKTPRMKTVLSFWATYFNFWPFSKAFLSIQTEQKTDYGQLDLNSQIRETKLKTKIMFLILIFWQFCSAGSVSYTMFSLLLWELQSSVISSLQCWVVCMAWKGLSDSPALFYWCIKKMNYLKTWHQTGNYEYAL